jgi:hypothetical protein
LGVIASLSAWTEPSAIDRQTKAFTDRLVQGKRAIGDASGSDKSKVLGCKLGR